MLTSSAKAKGRALLKIVRDRLIARYEFHPDDITVTPSGVFGEDLQLARTVKERLPLCWEGKNQEALSIWASLAQAERHAVKCNDGRKPILVFKRNRSEVYMSMKFEDFLDMIGAPKEKPRMFELEPNDPGPSEEVAPQGEPTSTLS